MSPATQYGQRMRAQRERERAVMAALLMRAILGWEIEQ